MQITPANLAFFFTTMETRFWGAFSLAELWNQKVATTYPVGSEQWVSGWIGMLDKLRVWTGPRITRTPAPQTYLVPIQPFELTEAVDKFKIQDDLYGIYYPIATHMGTQAKKWPDYQLRDLIENAGFWTGTYQNGTDGLTHWNSAHPIDFYDSSKGTYTNDYGAAGTSINGITVGGAFSTNAFNTVYEDMALRKNESGERFGLKPDLTMVPLTIKAAATTVLQSQFFAPPMMGQMGAQAVGAGAANAPFVGAMDNPLKGWTDLYCNYDLNGAAAWYMLDTSRVIKPFSWLLRASPQLIPRIDPTDPSVFETHTFLFGVEARGAPAWSLPFLSSRSGV